MIAIVDAVARELMLFAAAGFLLGGLDDLAVDLVYLVRRLRAGPQRPPRLSDLPLPANPPRIAVLVPAWQEAAVIGAMLTATLRRYRYRDFLVFVAVYPNDPRTVDVVAAIAERDERVRLVVNPRAGPTTKADNLNAAWAAVGHEEASAGRRFAAVMLHDAEDVVDRDELTLISALIASGAADAVQLPIVPLIHPGARLVSGHYADEFAEAHAKAMVVRQAVGAAMPLAGTGCAVSATMLRRVAAARGGAPFDATSLTEDYELGLAVAALGGRCLMARFHHAGRLVAVRAYFPRRFRAAARQKARWMVGIALAGWDRTGWAPARHLTDHWMRMRDRRAPLAVLVLAAAYAALLAWAVAAVAHRAGGEAVPMPAPAWILWANAALLGWRLAVRVAFTARCYGGRQGLWAAPRFVVGNLVALAAGPRALAAYLPTLFGRAPVWDKTEHEFPAGVAEPPVVIALAAA